MIIIYIIIYIHVYKKWNYLSLYMCMSYMTLQNDAEHTFIMHTCKHVCVCMCVCVCAWNNSMLTLLQAGVNSLIMHY